MNDSNNIWHTNYYAVLLGLYGFEVDLAVLDNELGQFFSSGEIDYELKLGIGDFINESRK